MITAQACGANTERDVTSFIDKMIGFVGGKYWYSASFWETGSCVIEMDAPEEGGNYGLRLFMSVDEAAIKTILFKVV